MSLPADFPKTDQTFSLYGKTIRSNYPVFLTETTGKPEDITIRFEGIFPKSTFPYPDPPVHRQWQQEGDYHALRYFDIQGNTLQFKFYDQGKRIYISQSWPEWRDTLFYILNPIMAAALRLSGSPVLHASSLVLRDYSFLIMGISEAGKSTLSTALAYLGMVMHSDDIAAPVNSSGDPVIAPGYDRIKVNSAVCPVLGLKGNDMLPIFSTPPEDTAILEEWITAQHFSSGFYNKPAPARAIFILDQRKENIRVPDVRLLPPVEATLSLTEHFYGRDWLSLPGEESLTYSKNLALSLPVYRVSMPDNIDLLKPSAKHILKNIIEPLAMNKADAVQSG